MTPEGKIKAKVWRLLKAQPSLWWFPPQAGPYGRGGIPDYIGCINGLTFAVECKADSSKQMTALQEMEAKKLQDSGARFFLVYDDSSLELLKKWIEYVRST